jgi:hypothetical protein
VYKGALHVIPNPNNVDDISPNLLMSAPVILTEEIQINETITTALKSVFSSRRKSCLFE